MYGGKGKIFVRCSQKNLRLIVHHGNFVSRRSAQKLNILTASSTPYCLIGPPTLCEGFPAALVDFFLFFAILKDWAIKFDRFCPPQNFFLPPFSR
jgi:hypothetical protein